MDRANETAERVLPHNLVLEQQVLGAVMCAADAMERVVGRLKPEHFYAGEHARIFRICETLFERDRTISPVAVGVYVTDAENEAWEEIGGRAYLAHLAANAATTAYVGEQVNDLIEYWRRREMIVKIDEVSPFIGDMAQPFDTVADALEDAASRLRVAAQHKPTIRMIGEAAQSAIERAEAAATQGTGLTGISTGLADLDAMTGGLAGGDMIVGAGRPSMGKTGLALAISRHVARLKRGVCYVTPEMTGEELAYRLLTEEIWHMGERVEYTDLKRGRFGDATRRLLGEARDILADAPLLIEEASSITMSGVRAVVKKAARQFERAGTPLGLVVVDHMGWIEVPSAKSEFEKISFVSGEMKKLAKSFDVPVLALSQLSRQVESRDDKRPVLSDLRQSGNIEQDADIVMFPYRHEYYLERSKPSEFKTVEARADWEADFGRWRNICELGIAKQRNGPVGRVRLFCDMGPSVFADLRKIDDRQEAMF